MNHPNICTIYDIGKSGEQSFIAMEFLDGVTLKHRLGGKALDVETCCGWPLSRCVERGTPQGDGSPRIKPANIFVTTEGHPKVLDFGLAKVTSISSSASQIASAHTQTFAADDQHLTSPGATLGTIAYMSSEPRLIGRYRK